MGQARIELELRFQKLWVVLLLEPLLVWKLNFTSNVHQDRLRFLVWLHKIMVCQTSLSTQQVVIDFTWVHHWHHFIVYYW